MHGSDPHLEGPGPSNPHNFEGSRAVWSVWVSRHFSIFYLLLTYSILPNVDVRCPEMQRISDSKPLIRIQRCVGSVSLFAQDGNLIGSTWRGTYHMSPTSYVSLAYTAIEHEPSTLHDHFPLEWPSSSIFHIYSMSNLHIGTHLQHYFVALFPRPVFEAGFCSSVIFGRWAQTREEGTSGCWEIWDSKPPAQCPGCTDGLWNRHEFCSGFSCPPWFGGGFRSVLAPDSCGSDLARWFLNRQKHHICIETCKPTKNQLRHFLLGQRKRRRSKTIDFPLLFPEEDFLHPVSNHLKSHSG